MKAMKRAVCLGALGLLGSWAAAAANAAETIRIGVMDAQDAPGLDGLPVVPWVQEGESHWKDGAPLFELHADGRGEGVQGWVALTDTTLHLRVVIDDAAHVPAPDTVQLWAADGIEIGVDARGDGAGRLPTDTDGLMGPDDAKVFVALTAEGVRGRCTDAEDRAWRGPLPDDAVAAARDEAAGTTTYEVALPWERFGTRPGLYPTMGLTVQVNDLDPEREGRRQRSWGDEAEGGFRPGRFERVALGARPPGAPWAASGVDDDIVWADDDEGVVVLVLAGEGSHVVEAQLGDTRVEREISGTGRLRRVRVGLAPGKTDVPRVPFEVRLTTEAGAAVAGETGKIAVVEATWRALNQRIDDAVGSASHPLFRRHLRSVRALATAEWARLALYRSTGSRGNAGETFGYVARLLAGFEDDAGEWEPYLRGERLLFMAYLSDQDRTLQHYALSLPRDWDPERAYPLFVELHGRGSENFLGSVARSLGPREEGEDRRNPVQRAGAAYWIMPSGRGNLGYRGVGEGDVWEAYDDVHRQFEIDEDRRYLYGFSMGGGGTWSLGTRTPDRWAALMIMAGGLWAEPHDHGLGRNIAAVPTYIWCGEEDFISWSHFPRMVAEIERWGGTPTTLSVPGLGHRYTPEIQEEGYEWLSQHVRKRPDRFSFVSDSDRHTGAWGIRMTRDLTRSGLPAFTCTIEDGVVRIDSEGTPGLEVILGDGGLGLAGDLRVVWNGEIAYEGPPSTVSLGDFRETRRRR